VTARGGKNCLTGLPPCEKLDLFFVKRASPIPLDSERSLA